MSFAIQPSAGEPVAWPRDRLEAFFSRDLDGILADRALPKALDDLLDALETGRVRAARPSPERDGWQAVPWVKTGILAGFRSTPVVVMRGLETHGGFDRAAFPTRRLRLDEGVRLVPGGSAVRRGAHLAPGVVVMPPSYVNVGAFVGPGTLVDSHVLVGSCAQIGSGVHLSAAVQIGGVLEPVGAVPVVVGDGAFLGAQCGVFEGVHVGAGAVLAPGVHLTSSTTVFDLVAETTWIGRVPPGAVVVPGTRPARGAFAKARGLALYAPVVVKHRDASTDAATVLEEALR